MGALTEIFSSPALLLALVTLVAMEIVLGIDNIIFVSVLANKLPVEQRARARRLGIGGALIMRLALLGTIPFIASLTAPLFEFAGHGFSGRDLVLLGGGLFLVWKATKEIHHNVDPDPGDDMFERTMVTSFSAAVGQMLLLNLVFSVDSIVTAIGMTDNVIIMAIAIVTSVAVMLAASGPLARFIEANPTVVMLALGFLLLIGTMLIADSFGAHVPKGYIYAAMAFSSLVEALNILQRRAARRKRAAALAAGAGASAATAH